MGSGPRFADANAGRYLELLWRARLAGIGWSLLGGWLVCRWAGELYGGRAGCLALVLWCFGPNILAHAPLTTPDLPTTVAGVAACYVFWRYLRKPTWTLAWFCGLLLGLALLTKFTWLILYGLWPFAALVYGWRKTPSPRRTVVRLGQMAGIFLVSLAALDVGYGFAETGRRLGEFPFVSQLLSGEPRKGLGDWGNRFQGSSLGRLPVPLPSDLVLGIDVQRRDFESNWPFYLAGEWNKGGRWYFYLYALLLKIPLGTLGLLLAALASMSYYRGATAWRDEFFLLLFPAALIATVSSQTGLNHFRYILPALPFLLIVASRIGHFLCLVYWRRGLLVLALTIWEGGNSLAVYPHSLSYVNEVAGGPENGFRALGDSNLDWGQDLLYLKRWLEKHPDVKQPGLAYFNHIDPRIVGITFRLPPLAAPFPFKEELTSGTEIGPQPGYFAVSVHFVQGGRFPAADGQGHWRPIPLGAYRYFREFQPITKAGYSIFIYHITLEDANRFRRKWGLPLLTKEAISPGNTS